MILYFKKNYKIIFVFLFYIILGFFSISWCPRVFVDEPDISSAVYNLVNDFDISKSMPLVEKDAIPRIFLIQRTLAYPFVKLLGYSPLSIRIPGYLFFLTTLIFLYLFFSEKSGKNFACYYCALFGLQLPIFWISHIYRPEIYIVFFLSVCLFLLTREKNTKTAFLLGLFSTIGIFSHVMVLWVPVLIFGLYFFPYLKPLKTLKSHWNELLLFSIGSVIPVIMFLYWIGIDGYSTTYQFAANEYKPIHISTFKFSKVIFKYLIADGGWRLYLAIITISILYFNIRKHRRQIIEDTAFFIYGLAGTLILLIVMGRASKLYFCYLSIWNLYFLVYALFLIKNQKIRNTLKTIVFLLMLGYITLYLYSTAKLDLKNYYQQLYKITDSLEPGSKILGRCEHHYFLSEKINYIYEWDFDALPALAGQKYAERYNNAVERYYHMNKFDYIIIDARFLKLYNKINDTENFLKLHAEKIHEVIHPYGGTIILRYPIDGKIIKFLKGELNENDYNNKTIIYKIKHDSFHLYNNT